MIQLPKIMRTNTDNLKRGDIVISPGDSDDFMSGCDYSIVIERRNLDETSKMIPVVSVRTGLRFYLNRDTEVLTTENLF
jgi:hypothetical protein